MERTLIQLIASRVDARIRCAVDCERPNHEHLREWIERHKDAADALCDHYMPSGSGIDNGTKIDWDRSKPERIVFNTSYHHMNDGGYYDGWTDHNVIVMPSLIHGMSIRITGRDRNLVKDYLHGCFDYALSQIVDPETEKKLVA